MVHRRGLCRERSETVRARCEEVIASEYEGNELDQLDYGVVRLKRPVEDREPLKLRDAGKVQPGAHLTLIGYPDGIPVKVDAGGVVFHVTDKRLVATNDSFSGHSGSVVLNSRTGRIEAVHVASGGDRFERDEEQDCNRAKQCQVANTDGECEGSIGVHVSQWRQFVEGTDGNGDGDAGVSDTSVSDAGDTGVTDVDAGTGDDVDGSDN